MERERRGRRIKDLNKRMEGMDLGGMTVLEEKAFDDEERRRHAEENWEEMRKARRELRTGKFGHLREVGVSNFVSAIEDESPNVWVVVHIYDQVSIRVESTWNLKSNLNLVTGSLYHFGHLLKYACPIPSLSQICPDTSWGSGICRAILGASIISHTG
jgi:hypothetical protein